MAAGITVYNDTNTVQISENLGTFQFLGKGTVNPGTPQYPIGSSSYPGGFGVTLTFAIGEIIAIKTTTGHWCSAWVTNYIDNSVQNIRFIGSDTITYYRFGYGTGIIPSGHSFEVYDGSGVLIFSDTEKSLKVLQGLSGYYSGLWGRGNNDQLINTINYDSNKSPAIVLGDSCRAYGYNGSVGYIFLQELAFNFNSSGVITTLNKIVENVNTGYDLQVVMKYPYYNYLVVDVTNL